MLKNIEQVSLKINTEIEKLFSELHSGISEREDSRAFGAMIEKKIKDNWKNICEELNYEFIEIPGRRTIYDFACKIEGTLFGFDIKTKDLDSNRYSDGGVCAVGNLLKFMANDKGVFMIVEFGHTQASGKKNIRDIEYIKIAPFHTLPENCYRIENLGTGQVRLNYTINQVWEELEWKRSYHQFFDIFTNLTIIHYTRVKRDAERRIKSIEEFRKNNYQHFKFIP
ncbi:MAG: hypothetical protein AB1304_07325 [Bacteroidota bacterium]